MFMVASSVVLTLVVLNYHHRTADIHTMGPWVICVLMFFVLYNLVSTIPEKLNDIFITTLTRFISERKCYRFSIIEFLLCNLINAYMKSYIINTVGIPENSLQ